MSGMNLPLESRPLLPKSPLCNESSQTTVAYYLSPAQDVQEIPSGDIFSSAEGSMYILPIKGIRFFSG